MLQVYIIRFSFFSAFVRSTLCVCYCYICYKQNVKSLFSYVFACVLHNESCASSAALLILPDGFVLTTRGISSQFLCLCLIYNSVIYREKQLVKCRLNAVVK